MSRFKPFLPILAGRVCWVLLVPLLFFWLVRFLPPYLTLIRSEISLFVALVWNTTFILTMFSPWLTHLLRGLTILHLLAIFICLILTQPPFIPLSHDLLLTTLLHPWCPVSFNQFWNSPFESSAIPFSRRNHRTWNSLVYDHPSSPPTPWLYLSSETYQSLLPLKMQACI